MKHLGKLLALAGLIAAVWLFLRDDPAAIWDLLKAAGPGLVLAGLLHVLPMVLNAQAWRVLLPGANKPNLSSMLRAVWIRESVNGLLPVARIGGEIASYRLLRRFGIRRAPAIASLTVDVALSIISQLIFALAGVAFLYAAKAESLAAGIVLGMVLLAATGIGFIAIQHAGPFERVMRVVNRFAAGRFDAAIGHSARIDRAVETLYRRRFSVGACLLWQLAGWIAGAAEIWTALHFLGNPVSPLVALIIESLIQAVSSAAFVVPAALGVQEAAFLAIGAALGLEPTAALALAGARRLRDLIVFLPGLMSWQAAEGQIARYAD
ncbi:MAG TPA: lysylphosphatidylglycerol synthase domain-containing protein [Dongiaceae bacterium]|nr:lysylphosphatidylglycerol synthase domain-containing protein [Dongiaceae bacterium]